MTRFNTSTALDTGHHAHADTSGATALLSALTELNELSAGHLRINELTLERCRVAAEWRQAVDEQGAVLLRTIRLRMSDVLSPTWRDFAGNDIADKSTLTPDQKRTHEVFNLWSEPLCEQIGDLARAHQDLQSYIIQLAQLMVNIEFHTASVMNCSDAIRNNELVKHVLLPSAG